MIGQKTALFVAVIVDSKGVSIHIPDLDMIQHGPDYVTAFADACMHVEAIHAYNASRGITQEIQTTFEDVAAMCKGKEDFTTCIVVG